MNIEALYKTIAPRLMNWLFSFLRATPTSGGTPPDTQSTNLI